MIGWQRAIDFGDAAERSAGCRNGRSLRQLAEALANARQAIGIVFGHVMCHAADGGVHARAAQRLGIDHLPGGALYEVRSAQSHEADALHHQDDVAQGRQIRSARDARPHHRGDLGDAEAAPHQRIVIEDAAGAVLARKDAVLIRQVDARRIHQVHDGQAVAHGDFLRAQNFGDGLRPPRAGLHGGVIGHDHRRPAFDFAQTRDYAGGRRLPVVAIVSDQQAYFEKTGIPVKQRRNTFPRRHLTGAMLLFNARGAAAFANAAFQFLQLFDQVAHVRLAGDIHVISTWRNR